MSHGLKQSQWEKILAIYLSKLLEGEIKLELIRKKLAKIVDFEPTAVFNRLDKTDNGFLSVNDIKQFLRNLSIVPKEDLINILIKFYSGSKAYLSYDDFLKIVMTKSDLPLRETVLSRRKYDNICMDYFEFKVEDALGELLKTELEQMEISKMYMDEIMCYKSFDVNEAFSCIDFYKTGIIDEKGLSHFLKNHDFNFIKNELVMLLKRMDKDEDNKVSFKDFKEFLGIPYNNNKALFSTPKYREHVRTKNEESYSSISKSIIDSVNKRQTYTSPKKGNSSAHDNIHNLFSQHRVVNTRTINSSNIHERDNYFNTIGETNLSPGNTNFSFNVTGFSKDSKYITPRANNTTLFNSLKYEHSERPLKVYMNNCINSYTRENDSHIKDLGNKFNTNNLIQNNDKGLNFSLEQLNSNISKYISGNSLAHAYRDTYTFVSPKALNSKDYEPNSNNNKYSRISTINNNSSDNTGQTQGDEASNKSNMQRSNTINKENNSVFLSNNNSNTPNTNLSSSQLEIGKKNTENELINYFAQFVKDVLIMYNKLEKIREVLNIDSNLYLDDLYKFFDRNGDMSINIKEFKQRLISLGVNVDYEELKLIFKRYDLEQNLSISYDEFCGMFYSKNPEYKKMICEKKSTDDDDEKNLEYVKKSYILKKFFKILIESEKEYEKMRKKLVAHTNFSLYEIYDNIRSEGSNKITKEDMKNFLKKNKVEASDYQIEILWDVFDKDRSGSISFKELVHEIYPKDNLNDKYKE